MLMLLAVQKLKYIPKFVYMWS